ncbi:Adenosine kinase [Parasponia andersonii]|uniref:Adenosine kinase n=1 Tax=Parasponia andersonii TaxID=3476 RepID=A0A2P5DU97_PARAD|nr:Adenosine kinase [Parasponia andersonii]
MESSARSRRRLDCISRHLSVPPHPNHFLQPVLLSSVQNKLKSGDSEPVIIGGMVLDIHAIPSIPANPGTTTPGKVNYVLGGVARNIADCMSKLGTKPFMISVLGLDMAGSLLLEHWKSAELSTEGILRQQDIKTPVVSNIFDASGESAAAVASAEAIEKFITPNWIQQFKHNIHSAPVLMIDSNLNLPALEASCRIAAVSKIPVWFEPVSVVKSGRIVSIAQYVSFISFYTCPVTFVSPNEDELTAMANALSGGNLFSSSPIESENSSYNSSIESLFQRLKPAIWVLLKHGIKIVVVTLGSNGVFLCSKGGLSVMRVGHEGIKRDASSRQLYNTVAVACPPNLIPDFAKSENSSLLFAVHFPALPASVVRLTGAGDCLVGGTLSSICAGLDLMQSVAVGIAAAKAAVESETNVPHVLNLAAIADDAELIYSAAKVVCHESML